MKRKYYKVVRENGAGEYESACMSVGSTTREFSLKYRVNEFVAPVIPNSKLFVFSNLEQARRFYEEFSRSFSEDIFLIFECEVKRHFLGKYYSYFSDVKEFWNQKNRKNCPRIQIHYPGTYYCSAVKLTKIVN